ncbi:MAG: hypothetical protein N2441_03910 [Rhodocyclaceae bacterium]|nr:hypothetical protein [Rhodocyclaceae bacterium]
MFARIQFVPPGSREKYAWVVDTEREPIEDWRRAHPEADELEIIPLSEEEGLAALFWQKCLYHDVFFERSHDARIREKGARELAEILELAGRLPKGKASELWNRCMEFRFGSDPIVRQEYGYRLPT